MRIITTFFLLLFSQILLGNTDYSIVFIHIGSQIPGYADTALSQAREFNPECPIILLANKEAIQEFASKSQSRNITYVAVESLSQTKDHKRFIKRSTLDKGFREGFWTYTSERFLYLNDYMNQNKSKNVFHMEYDNMLYADLNALLPIFTGNYKGIAATFDNDQRCIPGFIYFRDRNSMSDLARYFADHVHLGYNDMEMIAHYKVEKGSDYVEHLPIIMTEYATTNALVSPMGHTGKNPLKYCLHYSLFQSIFDAAAIGQFLGGIDPRNGPSVPGFINESCIFNPSALIYVWEEDANGRRVPYALYGQSKCRINNLHIHSKKLNQFH